MNCNDVTPLVEAYADGELEGPRGQAVENHLHCCARCAGLRDRVLFLRKRLRAEVPYFPASPELRARVIATVAAMRASEAPRPRPRLQRWGWLSAGALAGCMATVLAWVVGTAVLDWRANQDLAVEAVTAHVRATLNHDLIQVASSDQHTVKPWLSARLSYSPPVQDLSAEGFTLVGGRLDRLGHETVATLVYRYRLHTIDVFVRPKSTLAPSPDPRSVRGFNVAQATGSGMDWLAVSDVDAGVLIAFAQRLAHADTAQ